MQTFKGTLKSDLRVVVPQQFLEAMREAAQDSDATPFLKQVQANHPVNDDAFIQAILKNGLRKNIRDRIIELFAEAHLGGTVSPATIDLVEVPHDFNSDTPQPQVITKEAA